jgi:hypothetical protein
MLEILEDDERENEDDFSTSEFSLKGTGGADWGVARNARVRER